MKHLYSEHNPYRAAVLRERIEDGLLPDGIVDERDIEKIPDQDFLGYAQIHLFAGIGGFPLGMRRAGFPEHIRIVDGGFPCQDISNAGKCAGITGARSGLWREMVRCIRVVRPEFVFVENVAALLGRGMGVVLGDLAEIGYDAEGDCVSAADVGAPHLRRRIWIVAYAIGDGVRQQSIAERWRGSAPEFEHAGEVADSESDGWRENGDCGARSPRSEDGQEISQGNSMDPRDVADAHQRGCAVQGESSGRGGLAPRGGEAVGNTTGTRLQARPCGKSGQVWDEARRAESDGRSTVISDAEQQRLEGIIETGPAARPVDGSGDGSDSARWPVEPDVGRVAHGIPKRVDRLAALGDAIVPQCVEEIIRRLKT